MTPRLHHRICAHPQAISWICGASVMVAGFLEFLQRGTQRFLFAALATDWQAVLWLLIGVMAMTLLGWFMGMVFIYPWLRPLCCRCNSSPLNVGDRVQILTGPLKGTTSVVYEMIKSQGGWDMARLDLGEIRRQRFTDIFEMFSLLKIEPAVGAGRINPE